MVNNEKFGAARLAWVAGAWKVVGERENGRARGGHARGEGATSPLACLLLAHPLPPFGGWGKEIDDILPVV